MITRPRGTQDILPGEVEYWQKLESYLRRICSLYNEMMTNWIEKNNLNPYNLFDTDSKILSSS